MASGVQQVPEQGGEEAIRQHKPHLARCVPEANGEGVAGPDLASIIWHGDPV